MRLKVAEVLVDDGTTVSTLATHNADAQGIVQNHEQLWTIRVFVPAHVRADVRLTKTILALVSEKMHIPMLDADGDAVEPVERLIAERICEAAKLTPSVGKQIEQLRVAAKAGDSWDARVRDTLSLAKREGLVPEGVEMSPPF